MTRHLALKVTVTVILAYLATMLGLWAVVAVSRAHEGEALFNCRISGNATCGPDSPWHGFVGGAE